MEKTGNNEDTEERKSEDTMLNGNKLKRKKGRFYIGFVDFKTAIDRKILMEKLLEKGVRGRMLRMIENIYKETRHEVTMEDGITDSFKTNRGVR